jgi:hypothetical protein
MSCFGKTGIRIRSRAGSKDSDGRYFLKCLLGKLKRAAAPPVQLSVVPPLSEGPKPNAARPQPGVAPQRRLFPGNFYEFEFFIELKIGDVVHIGYPKAALTENSTGRVRWGSKIEWSWPDPNKCRVAWIDDEQRGFTHRILRTAEDALGAEGQIGDMRLRFEKILDLGKNQIVYALYCPEKNIRLAYGFARTVFEPTYVRPERKRT